MKRFYHYMDTKGMNEEWIETCYGDLRVTIEALADYRDIIKAKLEENQWDGFQRAAWECRMAKLEQIQRRLETSIGYDRDIQMIICQKGKGKQTDIGEDALNLLMSRGAK